MTKKQFSKHLKTLKNQVRIENLAYVRSTLASMKRKNVPSHIQEFVAMKIREMEVA